MLTLPIKKKWYDMILSGEKKEEYRAVSPYYTMRFRKYITLNPNYPDDYIQKVFEEGELQSDATVAFFAIV